MYTKLPSFALTSFLHSVNTSQYYNRLMFVSAAYARKKELTFVSAPPFVDNFRIRIITSASAVPSYSNHFTVFKTKPDMKFATGHCPQLGQEEEVELRKLSNYLNIKDECPRANLFPGDWALQVLNLTLGCPARAYVAMLAEKITVAYSQLAFMSSYCQIIIINEATFQ